MVHVLVHKGNCTMQRLNKRGNIWYYRKRIPTSIIHLCTVREINRPLSRDKRLALKIARYYDNLFNMIDLSLKVNQDPILYIKQLNLQAVREVDIYKMFLNSKQGISDTVYREYRQQLSLFQTLLPRDLVKLNYSVIERVVKVVTGLPKRNIQKYRDAPVKKLIKLKVPESDRISIKSQNEYLKTLKALFRFAYERQYIDREYAIKLFKNKVSARNQRLPLDKEDISKIFYMEDVSSMSKILYYSGMRLSEVYKCKLDVVDGIKVFDLTDTSVELKTESSHRIIPVHKNLEQFIENILEKAISKSDKYYSRVISKQFKDSRKSLYSMRHSFATELASAGIETGVISELLGHAHSGMTLSRYVKGFPVQILKDAVNTLSSD